jgi:hypothetical protein
MLQFHLKKTQVIRYIQRVDNKKPTVNRAQIEWQDLDEFRSKKSEHFSEEKDLSKIYNTSKHG